MSSVVSFESTGRCRCLEDLLVARLASAVMMHVENRERAEIASTCTERSLGCECRLRDSLLAKVSVGRPHRFKVDIYSSPSSKGLDVHLASTTAQLGISGRLAIFSVSVTETTWYLCIRALNHRVYNNNNCL